MEKGREGDSLGGERKKKEKEKKKKKKKRGGEGNKLVLNWEGVSIGVSGM